MKTIRGHLLQLAERGEFDVIVHGCNCHCTMGAGIALGIAKRFPAAFAADCRTPKGDRSKLGTCSMAEVTVGGRTLVIVNAYTQFDWRGRGQKADYVAIRSCLRWVAAHYSSGRIGLPKIGAGLAGGDWDVIHRILDEELGRFDATVVEFVAE